MSFGSEDTEGRKATIEADEDELVGSVDSSRMPVSGRGLTVLSQDYTLSMLSLSPGRKSSLLQCPDDLVGNGLADLGLAWHRVVPFLLDAFGTTRRRVSVFMPRRGA